jgi:hypothetical protein
MPQIRIPKSAEPLLPLCRKSGDALDNACFDTYADLLAFAAGCGYHSLGGRKPTPPDAFLSIPNAIDLAIFDNQKLLPALLLIGLATTGDYQITRDDESLCQLIESCVDRGAKYLCHELKISNPVIFHLDLAELLEDTLELKKPDIFEEKDSK